MILNSEDARMFTQSIIDTVREALVVLDNDLRVVSASKSFYRQFQVTPGQTEGRLIYELGNHQWDIPKLRQLLVSIIPSQTTIEDFEVRHRFQSIGEKVMLLNARRITQENNIPAMILLAIEDITEKTANQQRLIDSERKYHKFVEEINSIIIGFNREGNITFFNSFSEKLFGYSRDEAIGKPFVGTVIPCKSQSGQDNTRICEEIFNYPARYHQAESEGVCKDGSRILFSWSAKAVRDLSGQITEILIDGNDITGLTRERKEAEENSAILKALLDSIPEGIMITDVNNEVKRVSRHLSGLFDLSSEQLIHFDESVRSQKMNLYWSNGEKIEHPGDLPLYKTTSAGKMFTGQEIISRHNGSQKILSLSATPIRDSRGTITGAIGEWRDITQLHRSIEEIQKRKRVLDALMAYAPIGIMLVDRNGIITDVSRFLTELLHIPESELIGRDEQPERWKLIMPSTRKALHPHSMPLCRAIRKLMVVNDQEFLLIDDKEEHTVALSAAPVFDSNSNVIGGIAIWRDITALKNVQKAMQESESRLRLAQQVARIGSFEYDPIKNVSKWSPELEALYGLKPGEYRGSYEQWKALVYPEDLPSVERQLRESLSTGQFETEWRVVQPNGTIRWLAARGQVFTDGANRSVRMVGVNLDITGRKQAEEALRRSEATLSTIIDALPVGVITADAQGRLTRINSATRELWGIPPQTESWEQYGNWIGWWPQSGERIKAEEWALTRALRDGEVIRNELVRNEKFDTHEKRYYLANAVPLRDREERITGGVVAMLDITDRLVIEQELRKSEASLKRAQEIAHLGSWELDLAANHLTWSDEIYRIFGFQPQDFNVTYEIFLDCVHPDDRTAVNDAYLRSVREGRDSYEIEHRVVRKNTGEIRYVHEKCLNVRDSQGKIVRSLGMVHDITERKQVEEKLRQSQEQFAAAFRSVRDALIISEVETGLILDVNETWLSHWGYSAEQSIGYRSTELDIFLDIGDRDRFLQIVRKEGRLADFEILLRTKSGDIRNAILYVEKLMLPGRSLMLTIIHDITERKKAEEALRESEARFRGMFENHDAVMLLIEPESGKIVDANDAAEIFYGYSRSELRGMAIQQINQGPSAQVAAERYKAIEKKRNIFEFRHRISTGQIRTVEVYSSPVKVTDKLLLFSIIQDITERKALEKQLLNERDFVNAVIQTSGALITVIDSNGRITRFNKACEELTGYTAEEVKGRTVFDLFILPEEREKVIGVATRLFSGERRVDYENYWITKSGQKRFIKWQNSVLLDDKGVPAYSVATGIDITDRNRAESALRESESRFRGIFDNVAMGILLVDSRDHLIAANDYACQMLGYSTEDLLKLDVHNLTAPEDRILSDELNGKIHREELRRVAYEKRYLKADGSRLWVSVTISSIRDDLERHVGSVTTVEDISARKEVELALRASEERFRNLADNMAQFAWMADPEGWIFWYNKRWYDYTGTTLEDMQKNGWRKVHHPDHVDHVVKRFQHSLDTGRFWEDTFPLRSKDGEYRWFLSRAVPIRNDKGEIVRWLGTNTDITERLEVEQVLERRTIELAAANRDLESFSYSVSHDLRNPLSLISGFTGFLIEDYSEVLDDEGRDYLSRIEDNVKKMQSIINDMLNLSRVGRQEMERSDVNLSEIVCNYLAELKSTKPDRQMECIIKDNVKANADSRLIHLALENLLRNAWKFTAKKEIARIEFGTKVSDKQTVYFIRDNGAGFDMQYAQKIFEPFKRVHAEREFGGTGVGLSIVQRVVERHGGEVWAEGEVDKGAVFYFTLG